MIDACFPLVCFFHFSHVICAKLESYLPFFQMELHTVSKPATLSLWFSALFIGLTLKRARSSDSFTAGSNV